MKKIILIILALLISSACIKKEEQQSSEAQIVDLLNQNQIDPALQKINEELSLNKTDELLYLKASALSMKAGIDIYALFPLLKVKIFDVAISQWSENREFQKKSDAQKTGVILSSKDIEDQKNGNYKKDYVPLEGAALDYKIAHMWITNRTPGHGSCEIGMNLISVTTIDAPLWYTTILDSEEICDDLANYRITPENFEVSSSLDLEIRKYISENHRIMWFDKREKINRNETYIKIMGSFWSLIDMVPMLSKIPKVSRDGFKNLEEAQEILSKIREDHAGQKDEIGEKARKQLMMLSALKIVSHVQNGFNLSRAESPLDFLCNSNDQAAEELIDSEKDALFLIEAIDDPEIIKKNKELFDDVKSRYKIIVQEQIDHPEIKDSRILKFKAELERFKLNNCNQQNL